MSLEITARKLPFFDGVLAIAAENQSGGLTTNQEHFAPAVAVDPGVDPAIVSVLYDPQTSGGLLIASSPDTAGEVEACLRAAGVAAHTIGRATDLSTDPKIRVKT